MNLDERAKYLLLSRMCEGLHALIFGAYSTNSENFARQALADGGSIHEYVHEMLVLCAERGGEQIKSSGEPAAPPCCGDWKNCTRVCVARGRDGALSAIANLLLWKMNKKGWEEFRRDLIHHIANDEDNGSAFIENAVHEIHRGVKAE